MDLCLWIMQLWVGLVVVEDAIHSILAHSRSKCGTKLEWYFLPAQSLIRLALALNKSLNMHNSPRYCIRTCHTLSTGGLENFWLVYAGRKL